MHSGFLVNQFLLYNIKHRGLINPYTQVYNMQLTLLCAFKYALSLYSTYYAHICTHNVYTYIHTYKYTNLHIHISTLTYTRMLYAYIMSNALITLNSHSQDLVPTRDMCGSPMWTVQSTTHSENSV